jgi:diguanylate cyclase (GGDEF)-like protein
MRLIKNAGESGNSRLSVGDGNLSFFEQITPLARQINCLDSERIADVCIKKIPELVGVRFASIYMFDETNNILHLLKHNHPYLINKIVSLNQNPPTPMVISVRSKELILTSDINMHKRPVIKKSQRIFSENYETVNCAVVPLICQDSVVGALNLADKIGGGSFTNEDIVIIELFSQLVGASLGNVKLFEKIQKQAVTDGLTGLANHRAFYETLERELWRLRRYGGKISMIMVDVDDLKKVNDTYGHRVGDSVLRAVSVGIKESIRQIDTAARYGGDEFGVILPNTLLEDAVVVAQRILDAVSHASIVYNGQMIPVSVSVGLGQYDSTSTPEDITSRSDEALYSAKQSGKNNIQIFESLS